MTIEQEPPTQDEREPESEEAAPALEDEAGAGQTGQDSAGTEAGDAEAAPDGQVDAPEASPEEGPAAEQTEPEPTSNGGAIGDQEAAAPTEAGPEEGAPATETPAEAPVTEASDEAPSAEAPVEPEPVVEPEPAPAAASAPAARAEPAATPEAEEEEPGASDPFAGPGDWYVIHTYAGYENKVKTNLSTRIQTMQMQDRIFDVVIPMEDVMEIKGGKKQVVQKKVFPGYLLVKMVYDDDSWMCVRNTPGVTGFVSSGTGQKPTPLSRREVEKILAVKEEEAKKPAFRLEFEEGDVVRIISGPFAEFNGTISDINVDQSKVRVMVNIFDRETPVELSFDQVARV
ncbi:MAG: transcription termination/antitermination protein NusG [Actinomycetota bacterium]